MKVCPQCGKEYQDDMNYCLDDGEILYSDSGNTISDRTLSFGLNKVRQTNNVNEQTYRQRYGETGKNLPVAESPTAIYPSRKTPIGAIIASVIIGASILTGVFIYTVISRIPKAVESNRLDQTETLPSPKKSTPLTTSPTTTDKVKIEVGDKVKGGFNQTFIKSFVTNNSDQIIEVPRISLTLYKNDLKIVNVSGEAGLKYLKPNQSVPVWINIYKDQDFTAARTDEEAKYRIAEKDANLLFPNVIYTDTNLSSKALTSLYNFRPYKEIFYSVNGTVENRDYDLLKTKIYVVFYNDKSEIVGIANTNPPDLKRNEKAQFEASMGDRQLFGIPTKFELIAVDDSRVN